MDTKNIIVFGATGLAGLQVVKRGLECGYKVTAFVRNPKNIRLLHPNLKVVQGDALISQDVTKHIKGVDAVVSALNAYESHHRLAFINNIINGMREHKINRIIAIGGIGALQASENMKVYETPNFPREYIGLSLAHEAVLDALVKSFCEFTFVCPLFIAPGERTGIYNVQDKYPVQEPIILSGDLADFIIKELEENKFLRTKVGIGNKL